MDATGRQAGICTAALAAVCLCAFTSTLRAAETISHISTDFSQVAPLADPEHVFDERPREQFQLPLLSIVPSVTDNRTPAAAESPSQETPGSQPLEPYRPQQQPSVVDINAGALLVRIASWTLLVLMLFAVCVFALKKVDRLQKPAGETDSSLRVIDQLRPYGRCKLMLVEADTHRFLVGMDHNGLKAIHAVPGAFSDVLEASETDVEDVRSAL